MIWSSRCWSMHPHPDHSAGVLVIGPSAHRRPSPSRSPCGPALPPSPMARLPIRPPSSFMAVFLTRSGILSLVPTREEARTRLSARDLNRPYGRVRPRRAFSVTAQRWGRLSWSSASCHAASIDHSTVLPVKTLLARRFAPTERLG